MEMSESELLVRFARELREIVESFEEEAEILADRDVLNEIRESEDVHRKGEAREFDSMESLRKEIGL